MKTERINGFNTAYSENNINRCISELIVLMMMYDKDIKEGKPYDHDLKHILFKANCIHNPIGMKYTKEDYEKTANILYQVMRIANVVNDPRLSISDTVQESVKFDDRIMEDLLNAATYTECLYKINATNTKRMDTCEVGKVPFVEQLISIILFYQDQIRLVRENYTQYLSSDYMTGMELSIADKPVEHYEDVKSSVSDNFESILEGTNQIINYLYYRFGKKLNDRIDVADIQSGLIHPYENEEFERYLYIAIQRCLICQVEEGIRYGYYKLEHLEKLENGIQSYTFSIENEEKYKARRIGILRREYQVRQHVFIDPRNREDISAADEKIAMLSDELSRIQDDSFVMFDFSEFHPDKTAFLIAEKIGNTKERIVESLTKDYYLACEVKGVKVRDIITAYKFLSALAEILYGASIKYIDGASQETILKEISIVDISYLSEELTRLHGFETGYARKLIDKFIFHEKNNRDDDVFAQPLLKISKTQVVISHALIDQVNLDRAIERQFIRYEKNVAEVGHIFEKRFICELSKGYRKKITDFNYKKIPDFQVNTNEVKYEAFDGKEIEYDVISVLGDYLILTELKAIMTSYDLNDLEERKQNVKKAIKQLRRRKESVRYDWDKFKKAVSVELPDEPYDDGHIILVACTDTYDYTPLKSDDVFITDESSYLKYFTNPCIDILTTESDTVTITKVKSLWKHEYPDAKEFMEYLLNPVSTSPFAEVLKKKWTPVPVMDQEDCAIFFEEYEVCEDPIMNVLESVKNKDISE